MIPDEYPHSGGSIVWTTLLLGIALGIGLGLLYTWEIDPVVERNTAPWQLSKSAREDYVVAVALSYAYNRDLNLAFDRLRALRPNQDVWSMVADVACDRVSTRKTKTNTDVRAIRALEQLYRPQGASGCADGQYPTPAPVSFVTPVPSLTPTATLVPPATKTPTPAQPTDMPFDSVNPTRTPFTSGGRYVLSRTEPFCDPALSGVIEVRVFDRRGQGVGGIPVTVTAGVNEKETFFTGLKPGREPGYADYQMTPGKTYTVSIPNLASSPRSMEGMPCTAIVDGEEVTTTTSYWINFQEQNN